MCWYLYLSIRILCKNSILQAAFLKELRYQNKAKILATCVVRHSCTSVCHFVESSLFLPIFLPAEQFIVYLPTLTLGPAALPKNTLCQPNFLNLPSRRLFLTGFCQDRRSSRAAFSPVFLPYHANATISVTSNRPVLALFLLFVQHFFSCVSSKWSKQWTQ